MTSKYKVLGDLSIVIRFTNHNAHDMIARIANFLYSSMNTLKETFIKLAIDAEVLKFGEFQLKSGRISPYFFNAGLFYTGKALQQLGQCYASLIIESGIPCDHLFGPAYKGLPLATATAIALAAEGKDVAVTFNRKEAKSHGEGGTLIGAPLQGPTLMIDDVITAGTAFRESQKLIADNGGILSAVLIALDRCERGQTDKSTISEIEAQGIKVYSIINFFDLIDYFNKKNDSQAVKALIAYHEDYGVRR